MMKRTMMKTALLMSAMLAPGAAQADHYKVFLLAGQSNMDGRADPDDLPASYQQPQEDVLFSTRNYFGPLQENNGFGPELSFGRTLADALPGENFALFKYAAGGTSLYEDWAPVPVPGVDGSGDEYTRLKNTVNGGRNNLTNAGHTFEIVGMVWVQGESDAAEGRTTAQYQADLTNFIADIRSNYGADLPFIYNRIGSNQYSGDPFEQISTAQENVNNTVANTYMVYVDDLPLKDSVHFNTQGTITLGERLAGAYLSSVPEPTSLMLLGFGGMVVLRRRRDQCR